RAQLAGWCFEPRIGFPCHVTSPVIPPVHERRSQVPQSLQGVEVRSEWYHDMIRSDHHRPVYGAEIRADVAWHDPEVRRDLLDVRVGNAASAPEQWFQRPVYRKPPRSAPQLLDAVVIKKRSGQIGLRVEIDGNYGQPEFAQHPGKVIDQRRLADAALVVEESHNRCRHRFSLTIAATAPTDAWNSSEGFPFWARRSRAICIPTPNRCTNPSLFSTPASVGLR